MKLVPLKDYREPEYPTKEEIQQQPEILHALPRRWQNSGGVLGNMARIMGATTVVLLVVSLMARIRTPGISISPAFLAEDEARQIIEQEARDAGLEFPEHRYTLSGVDLPMTDRFAFLRGWFHKGETQDDTKFTSARGDAVLDGWNPKLQVGYKFVIRDDFKAWQDEKRPRGNVRISDAGKWLQPDSEDAKKSPTVAVFYQHRSGRPPKSACASPSPSPITAVPTNPMQSSSAQKDAVRHTDARKTWAEEDLRRQVRGFLEWIRMQEQT